EDKNIQVKGLWFGGFKQFTNSKKPLKEPQDFKGLKFRVMATGLLSDQFSELSANSAVLPFDELYVALEQGTVDGQENAVSDIYSQKFYEVQQYLTISDHAPATHPLIVDASFWDNLPDDIREELDDIIEEVTENEVQNGIDLDTEFLNKIEDTEKMEIIELTEEERKEFQDAMEPLYDKYGNDIGEEYIKKAREVAD